MTWLHMEWMGIDDHDSWVDCGEQKRKLLKANYSGSKACHHGQN